MNKETMDYAKKQGYTEENLSDKKCLKCGCTLFKEKFELVDEYPYYCPSCDENMFGFEAEDKK